MKQVKLTGRTEKRYAGVFGPIENVRVPVGCKPQVLEIIAKYKESCIKEADKSNKFNLQSVVKQIKRKHNYSSIKSILSRLTRAEMLEVVHHFDFELSKKYHTRAEIETLLLDRLVH